ncbi:MAG: tail fiber domain-containing protein [Candidatus Binatus sp.]
MMLTRHLVEARARSTGLSVAALLVIAVFGAGTAAAQSPTELGTGAQAADRTRADDTRLGAYALNANSTGSVNTAIGANTLQANTTGSSNTASGGYALYSNTQGYDNTATGAGALYANTTGIQNTATGWQSLNSNSTGSYNTATGKEALFKNTSGLYNTASGADALFADTTGSANTASGMNTLQKNTTGASNTASGMDALQSNTTGSFNTAVGYLALKLEPTGSYNIALGATAGAGLTTGSSNIDIGNSGFAADSNIIRIGTSGSQTATYVAGISGTNVTSGTEVVVNSAGQLGVVVSSARFKRDIQDMGAASRGLMKLRPVTFRYQNDQSGTLQYGLVAEEVARVYRELVTYGADGKVETVRYSMLSAMLLNELQKQTIENARLAQRLKKVSDQMTSARREITELKTDHDRERAQRASFERRLSALESGAEQARNADRKIAAAFSR